MKLNGNKTKTMIVSRSRTMHPPSPQLTIDGTVVKECDDLDILRVTFDSKMTFEKHLPSVSRASSQTSWEMLSGLCPSRFEVLFGSVVLGSDTHLKLLDRVVSGALFRTRDVLEWDIAHRLSMAVLCIQ